MAAGRGRLSTIDLLPPEAEEDVEWAHRELAARARTIDEIRASFNTRLLAKGIKPISRSAFHRSSMRLTRMATRLGEVREIAGVLSTRLEDGGDEDLTLMLGETIKVLVYEMLEGATELKADVDTAEMLQRSAAALKAAEDAKRISADTRKRYIADFTREATAAVDQVAKKRGLDAGAVEAIKSKFLGIGKG